MIATITGIMQLNDHDFIFNFECREIAKTARPGQFVEVKVSEGYDPFLRRPFSVYDVDGDTVKLLIRVVGAGTSIMSAWRVGDTVDLLGPLGNCFTWDPNEDNFILMGGGIGYAPLNFLLSCLRRDGKHVHLLFSPLRESELVGHLQADDNLSVTLSNNRTEMQPLLEKIILKTPDTACIYSCGPNGMMKLIAETGIESRIPTQVSMEAAMGCGFDICACCVIPVRDGDGFTYKKACSDGPIFSGEEVIFNE